MSDAVEEKFIILPPKQVRSMLRKHPEELAKIANSNDQHWAALPENKAFSIQLHLVKLVSQAATIQARIKKDEAAFAALKADIMSFIQENKSFFESSGVLSYDRYGNMTVKLSKTTLNKNLHNLLGADALMSVFENIMPVDKEAQKIVLQILVEELHMTHQDFMAVSNFKISDVLKRLEASPDKAQRAVFDTVSGMVRKEKVARLTMGSDYK
ncbi:MAG: hypothetical protein ACP5UH_01705 [Candidatus Micrarchaeia archaeon]